MTRDILMDFYDISEHLYRDSPELYFCMGENNEMSIDIKMN